MVEKKVAFKFENTTKKIVLFNKNIEQ